MFVEEFLKNAARFGNGDRDSLFFVLSPVSVQMLEHSLHGEEDDSA